MLKQNVENWKDSLQLLKLILLEFLKLKLKIKSRDGAERDLPREIKSHRDKITIFSTNIMTLPAHDL